MVLGVTAHTADRVAATGTADPIPLTVAVTTVVVVMGTDMAMAATETVMEVAMATDMATMAVATVTMPTIADPFAMPLFFLDLNRLYIQS
jgi:hypothetical protein